MLWPQDVSVRLRQPHTIRLGTRTRVRQSPGLVLYLISLFDYPSAVLVQGDADAVGGGPGHSTILLSV